MKIEILFPEACNLFGDLSNIKFLRQCLPQAEFIETPFSGEPLFATEDVSLIYLGPMTEGMQEKVIEKLRPHRDRMYDLMNQDVCFLFTGNAMETLGTSIEREDGSAIPGLAIFELTARRDMMHRHNSTFLGSFEGESVMGFKSQFSMAYTPENYCPLFTVERGCGLNKKWKTEGILYHNFFGTYLLGPILILNPPFARKFLERMGVESPELVFAPTLEEAYQVRLKDFREKT